MANAIIKSIIAFYAINAIINAVIDNQFTFLYFLNQQ